MNIESSTLNVLLSAILACQAWQIREIFALKSRMAVLLAQCPLCNKPRGKGLGVLMTVFFVLVGGLAITGCATGAPTRLEQRLFTIQTNYVPSVVTNTVVVTNEVVLWRTNEVAGVITVSTTTNRFFSAEPVSVTNWTPSYDYQPGAGAATVQGVGKAVGAPFGAGELVSVALGGIFGIWGMLRGNKAKKVSAVLAQGIETSRALLATTPQGVALDARFKDWLIKHQKEEGVLTAVIPLLKEVDPALAEFAAERLKLPATP